MSKSAQRGKENMMRFVDKYKPPGQDVTQGKAKPVPHSSPKAMKKGE